MQEFPKMLYRGADVLSCLTDERLALDAEQEEEARQCGYAMYTEIHARATRQTATPRKARAKSE